MRSPNRGLLPAKPGPWLGQRASDPIHRFVGFPPDLQVLEVANPPPQSQNHHAYAPWSPNEADCRRSVYVHSLKYNTIDPHHALLDPGVDAIGTIQNARHSRSPSPKHWVRPRLLL